MILVLHFNAVAFLVTTSWSKECVITGIEGLSVSSGCVLAIMTGTVHDKEHILLDCPH